MTPSTTRSKPWRENPCSPTAGVFDAWRGRGPTNDPFGLGELPGSESEAPRSPSNLSIWWPRPPSEPSGRAQSPIDAVLAPAPPQKSPPADHVPAKPPLAVTQRMPSVPARSQDAVMERPLGPQMTDVSQRPTWRRKHDDITDPSSPQAISRQVPYDAGSALEKHGRSHLARPTVRIFVAISAVFAVVLPIFLAILSLRARPERDAAASMSATASVPVVPSVASFASSPSVGASLAEPESASAHLPIDSSTPTTSSSGHSNPLPSPRPAPSVPSVHLSQERAAPIREPVPPPSPKLDRHL